MGNRTNFAIFSLALLVNKNRTDVFTRINASGIDFHNRNRDRGACLSRDGPERICQRALEKVWEVSAVFLGLLQVGGMQSGSVFVHGPALGDIISALSSQVAPFVMSLRFLLLQPMKE